MRTLETRRIALAAALLVALAALVACQPGLSQGKSSSTPRPSTAPSVPADAQRCARLAKLGFSKCPPAPDKLEVPPTTIRNATNGAIDEHTAQRWGRAFQQTEGYYRWAMKANLRDALTSGAFADSAAAPALFGKDLEHLDQAASEHALVVDQFETITQIQLVSIPADLQSFMRRDGFAAQPFGVAAEYTGPASRSIHFADGHEVVVATRSSNDRAKLLVWGEFRSDPDLGAIWYQQGIYQCERAVQDVCQF